MEQKPRISHFSSPTEVLRIAEQAAALGGETASLLIITAGWTGCRWGELTGPHRDNVDLDRGVLIIDARTGTLHENAHTRWLGAPKTASSARTITLFIYPEHPVRFGAVASLTHHFGCLSEGAFSRVGVAGHGVRPGHALKQKGPYPRGRVLRRGGI